MMLSHKYGYYTWLSLYLFFDMCTVIQGQAALHNGSAVATSSARWTAPAATHTGHSHTVLAHAEHNLSAMASSYDFDKVSPALYKRSSAGNGTASPESLGDDDDDGFCHCDDDDDDDDDDSGSQSTMFGLGTATANASTASVATSEVTTVAHTMSTTAAGVGDLITSALNGPAAGSTDSAILSKGDADILHLPGVALLCVLPAMAMAVL